MKPIVITDVIQVRGDVSVRERTFAIFGIVLYRKLECYPIDKDRSIGFNSCGTNLTYVEDE